MTKHQKHAGFESTLAPTVSGIVMVSLVFHRLRCVSLADPACAGSQAFPFFQLVMPLAKRIFQPHPLEAITCDHGWNDLWDSLPRGRCGDVVEQKLDWLLKPMHKVENKPKVNQTLTIRS